MTTKKKADQLPYFICIGVQKSATTTLYDLLKTHPDIYLPHKKETKFFQYDEEYEKGIEYYSRYFDDATANQVKGEIDPSYIFYCEKTLPRIKEKLGDEIKIIVMLRNPVDRAYSHYLMSLKKGFEKMSFEDAVFNESVRLKSGIRNNEINFSYITRGLYFNQLKKCFGLYDRKQFLILTFDEFIINRDRCVLEIEKFIGVRELPLEENVKSNAAKTVRSSKLTVAMREKSLIKQVIKVLLPFKSVRKNLRKGINKLNEEENKIEKLSMNLKEKIYSQYFKEDVEQLETLLGLDLSAWKYNSKP